MKISSVSFEIDPATQVAAQGKHEEVKKRESAKPPATETRESSKVTPPVVNGYGLGLEFSRDGVTGQRVITVYDLETGKIVRQIPPKEMIIFLRQFQRSKGLFFARRS